MKAKIVVADDEPRIRKMIARLLTDEGYDVMPVENGREAVEALLSFQPDVILLDQQMPVLTGVEALEEIRRISPTQVVLFVTAFGSISLAVDAVKKGAYDFIEKPFDNDKLLLTVKRAVEHSRMKGEISTLKKTLGEKRSNVIGENTGLKQVMAQVLRVAETNATVLIHGESGTGKELIARAVHHNSLRANGPFVAINCGAIPLTLMESELFGHERGAFTDAKEAKAGTFERANGGTLFLDEVGELPLDAQVKLLRVLEERKITRIGGKKAIPVDVRIVAATNRNLDDEVKGGHFRLDLLYRLNVFTLIFSSNSNEKYRQASYNIRSLEEFAITQEQAMKYLRRYVLYDALEEDYLQLKTYLKQGEDSLDYLFDNTNDKDTLRRLYNLMKVHTFLEEKAENVKNMVAEKNSELRRIYFTSI